MIRIDMSQPCPLLFPSGRIVATPGAISLLDLHEVQPHSLLRRHQAGDFGDLCEDDKQANIDAIATGERVLSSYQIGEDKIWIITEADRSSTCLLLPEDY